MADIRALPWRRGQDWVSLAAGGYLALAPLWVEAGAAARWAMAVTGLVIVGLALVALAMPGAYVDEWMLVAAAAAAFVAPWLFSYADVTSAAWTSWLVGILVAVSALVALPDSRVVHREQRRAGHGGRTPAVPEARRTTKEVT